MDRKNVGHTRLLLAAFAISGAAALIYEVAWTRALSLVLGSTTYALSTMLATFMAGLALGGFIGGKLADRTKNTVLWFGALELGIGVLGLVSVPLIRSLPVVYLAIYKGLHLYPSLFYTIQVLLCALVMLAPTMLMGATFPLVARSITTDLNELGRQVGNAYSLNTVGAVIGSLLAGFMLVPVLGVKGATVAAGCLNLAVGVSLIAMSGTQQRKTALLLILLYPPAAGWALSTASSPPLVNFYNAGRYLDGSPYRWISQRLENQLERLSYTENAEGPVLALRSREGHLVLQVSGKPDGTGATDLEASLLLAYLPIALHEHEESMLIVGLGAGVTTRAARDWITDLTVLELNPGVVEAVERHGPPGALDGFHLILDDARNALLKDDRTYDIITSAPSYPSEAGVSSLFTVDAFELAASRLEPNGLMCLWLPYHILSDDDVAMMIKTFTSVFPEAAMWRVHDSQDLIMVGSRSPLPTGDLEAEVARLDGRRRNIGFSLSRSSEELRSMADAPGIPLNTDDLPLLEFHVVRSLRLGSQALRAP